VQRLLPFCVLTWLFFGRTASAGDFALVNGDRVAIVGSTLIEREPRYGYWETALTSRYPEQSIVFRNLGWSGDTVFGHARAGFGGTADGFRHLKEDVLAVKPTVILVAYGLNESFEGEAGLPRFREGLSTLLDTLAVTKARIVLLSPPHAEDRGRPLPEPTTINQNLERYRDVLREVAEKRGLKFADLFRQTDYFGRGQLTDNGIHLNGYGYWRAADSLERSLGFPRDPWLVDLATDGKSGGQHGARVDKVLTDPLRFSLTSLQLPPPPAPREAPAGAKLPDPQRLLRVRGLAAGKYVLRIDGKDIVTATAGEWAAGVKMARGPDFDQAEALRQAIVAKNQLYFHRWRPQNETYLFGFRKNEQGQNAREVPEFDPLVQKAEDEIAKLRAPVAHQYELLPQREKDQ
jgi:lysophospholipase L1-like esterase